MSFVHWNEVYHELWLQAAKSRGTVTRVGELPGAAHHTTLPEWPRTTGADVTAIAALVDPILNAIPLRPGGYGVTRLWQTAVIDIEAIAFPSPAAEYVHNPGLWSTLLAVAAHLRTIDAPVPDDEAWDMLMDALWSPVSLDHRNASGLAVRTLTRSTFDGMWSTLRDELAAARGSDLRDDELGGIIEVPRTTDADAARLVAYWGRALVQLQVKVMMGDVPSPEDFEDVQLEWQAVSADVDRIAGRNQPGAVYPDNLVLWRATRALAAALRGLAAIDIGPAPYELIDDSQPARPPLPHWPPASPAGAPKATDLSARFAEVADGALTAFAQVAQDASDRLVATVGKPLLAAGATVAALLLIWYGTAPCTCDCPDETASTHEAA